MWGSSGQEGWHKRWGLERAGDILGWSFLVWFGLGYSSGTVNSHTAKSRRPGETA